MNQILKPEMNDRQESILLSNNGKYEPSSRKVKNSHIYKFQFIISSFIAFCFLIALFVRILKLNENEKISKQLMDTYHVSTLYSNTTDYSAQFITSKSNNSSKTPFVIGMIKIDKISLNYPILSESNKELLDVSLCRFAGPMPNQVRKSLYCWSQLCRLQIF